MGGGQAKPVYEGPRKRIVIIGASFAGHNLAKGLIQCDLQGSQGNALEIILIDKSEHFENNCGLFKMFTDDCFDEHIVKFEDQLTNYGSSHI